MTPGTSTAFKAFHVTALRPDALDLKTKELIALACGISRVCEGCVVHHAKAARAAGATMDELQSALDVCVMMGGGPATVYGHKALEAWKSMD